MIFDKIDNVNEYTEDFPLLSKVAEFVDRFNKENLSDGTYKIDGDRLYAMVQTYKSRQQTAEMMFEAHRKYIDVQYIVRGMEKIRYAKLLNVELVEERYSQGGDIAFYEGDAQCDFTLTKGTFLLLEPQDAHLPGLSAEKDIEVRKIVFKLQVEK